MLGHIIAASLFSVLGALQFESDLRRNWRRWHRYAGRVLVLCGLLTAATGIWMTLRYAIQPQLQGRLRYWVRLAVGSSMGLALVLGVRAIRGGDGSAHQAWMMRAYALAQVAGTQAQALLLLVP